MRGPAVIRAPGFGPVRGKLLRLSAHGLLVALPGEIPLGVEVTASLEVPGEDGPLELTALGVRADRDSPGSLPVNTGFQIMHASPSARRRIRELVFGA